MSRPADYGVVRPRRRGVGRHVRAGVTMLVLLGLVTAAAWYGWRALTDPPPDDVVAVPTCEPAATPVQPNQVRVNVYNSTQRPGLAARVADLLRERGFVVVDVANDPLRQTIRGSAEVRAGPAGQRAAALVRAQVPKAKIVTDTREERVVDLVLGEGFERLSSRARATVPPPTPRPSGSAPAAC